MKSIAVSVMMLGYDWIDNPWRQYLFASYAGSLSKRDSNKTRRLLSSPWYMGLFGDSFELQGDNVVRFDNDHAGYRIATSIGAATTGEGGDILVQDDPHNAIEAQSDTIRLGAIEWRDQAWSSRHNNPKTGVDILVMQRLHEMDMTGHVLAEGGWEHLCLPARYDGRKIVTCIGWVDPRTTLGEPLWPERFGEAELAKLEKKLGLYGTSGQLQQRPSPASGGIINTAKLQLWPANKPLPEFTLVIQSYDTAIEVGQMNDDTACVTGGVFMYKGRYRLMVLDSWAEQMQYPALRKRIKTDLKENIYGEKGNEVKAQYALVENKGSGTQARQDLANARIAIVAYNPGRLDKVARARLRSALIEDDLVYVLESSRDKGEPVTWARPLIKNLANFPLVEHDDLTDAFVQLVAHLADGGYLTVEDDAPEPDETSDSAPTKRGNVYMK
jgi:predicted phage terminase large subunit-like protein